MNISPINNIRRPSFKASVSYENKLLSKKPACCKKNLRKCGSRNTIIDVLELKKSAPDEYSMRFKLQSEAFGTKEHTTTFKVKRNRNRDKEDKTVIYKYFSDGKTVEKWENQTLRHQVIQRIRHASLRNKYSEESNCIDPIKIADEILDDEKRQHAQITDERLDSVHEAMKELQNDIAYVGTNGKVLYQSGKVEYTLLDE